jgi:hypothetical protein
MSSKLICDFCLTPITSGYSQMTVQSVADGTTGDSVSFDFHGSCYNKLQKFIQHKRPTPPLLDPTPQDVPLQPIDPNDPIVPDPDTPPQ